MKTKPQRTCLRGGESDAGESQLWMPILKARKTRTQWPRFTNDGTRKSSRLDPKTAEEGNNKYEAELNEILNIKTIRETSETKIWFFKKVNKTDFR